MKTMALQLGQPEMWYFGGDIGGDSPELEELRNRLSSESNGVPEWNRGRQRQRPLRNVHCAAMSEHQPPRSADRDDGQVNGSS